MRNGPDDVFWAESRIATEKDVRKGRLVRHRIYLRHAPSVELEAEIALDPRKGILLPDRDQDIITFEVHIGLAGRLQPAASHVVDVGGDLLEHNTGQPARTVREFLGDEVVQDRDALVHRVLFLPGRGLHLLEAGAHDDLHIIPAEAPRGPAAIHGGVAAAEHDDAAADPGDVLEGNAGEPIDADVDVARGFLAPRNIKVTAARR